MIGKKDPCSSTLDAISFGNLIELQSWLKWQFSMASSQATWLKCNRRTQISSCESEAIGLSVRSQVQTFPISVMKRVRHEQNKSHDQCALFTSMGCTDWDVTQCNYIRCINNRMLIAHFQDAHGHVFAPWYIVPGCIVTTRVTILWTVN